MTKQTDGLYVQCNQPPFHPDSQIGVRGRKEVNRFFLSYNAKGQKFDWGYRVWGRGKRGVKKLRFMNSPKGDPNVLLRRPKDAKRK